MPKRDTDALTPQEVTRVIQALPEAGWLRLHKVAQALCRHTGFDPEDLLQEAFQRALDGSRRCPRDVDVVRFLAGAMRSIASDWTKARRRRLDAGVTAVAVVALAEVTQATDPSAGADELVASAQDAGYTGQAILALFADDLIAQRLVAGIMEGLQGKELRILTSLSETAFASKRRLIRRRVDKANRDGEFNR